MMLASLNNVKIALCFYGFCRTLPKTIRGIKENLIDLYNPDIFICTPNTFFSYSNQDPFNSKSNPEYITSEYILSLFEEKLKSHQIIDNNINIYKEEVVKNNLPESNFMSALSWRTYSMMDCIRRTLWLRQDYEKINNIKYDLVILMRPDLILATKLKLEGLDFNKVQHSISHSAPIYGLFKEGKLRDGGDHLLISRPENIDVWIELYDKIAYFYKQGVVLNNETLLYFQLTEKGIDWEKSDLIYHGVER